MTAVSFVAQAVAMMRLAKTAKEMKERVDVFLPKAERLKLIRSDDRRRAAPSQIIAMPPNSPKLPGGPMTYSR